MLSILIIDDEPPARSRLRRLLEAVPDCEVVGEAHSGDVALELIGELQPDVLLLDISMPGLDGMTLARTLQNQEPSPAVVFCTAWPDQALEAFDCNAVDYLVKPVRVDRLRVAIDKARRVAWRLEPGESRGPFLSSTVAGRTELVAIADVVCLLAEDKYTTVLHGDGKAVINESLVELEKRFPEHFLRVHRNALVARVRIRGLDRSGRGAMCVIMDEIDYRPEVSRRNLPAVRQALKNIS